MSRFSRHTVRRFCCGCLAALLFASGIASAEDVYFEIPIDKLKITEGKLPDNVRRDARRFLQRSDVIRPYAVLDGAGEVYLGGAVGRNGVRTLQFDPRGEFGPVAEDVKKGPRVKIANRRAIAIRVPKGRTVTGTLYVPNRKFNGRYNGMVRVRFSVPAAKASPKAKGNFYLTKRDHYRELQALDIPGRAWFRTQAALAESQATGKAPFEPIGRTRRNRRREMSQMEDTFRVFSGGRAISENLQLDRLLRATKPGPPSVDLKTLPGITVAEMDWSKLTKDIDPALDPLAEVIPHDQHAIFFPTFRALTTMIDEASSFGTPVLQFLQPRAESARSKERYEKQLCLEVSAISRLLGPKAIRSVAFTGSDPYLRTGTDVAVLFEAKSSILLRGFLSSKHVAALKLHPGCKTVKGTVETTSYTGVVSPDRSICSYAATVGKTVVVTNSLAQLRRIIRTHDAKTKSLASLPEYRFFRHRYKRGDKDESGLLIVTDATIRRWCGPKWRIATSRRSRATAIMSHYQALHLDDLANGRAKSQAIKTKLYVPDLGVLTLTKDGVTSSAYGSLQFMTPIAELDFEEVTKEEAQAYRQWRDSYQRYWRQFFDPIAVRFSVRDDRVAADVTVMPLIQQTDYREFIQLTGGAKIKPNAGDRHPGALLHWALAFNANSSTIKDNLAGLPINPLSWMGDSIAVFADADKFWLDLAQAKDKETFFQKNLHRLPVAFRAEVKDGVKLAAFLTTIKALAETSAPGLLRWDTLKHNGQQYVRISATEKMKKERFVGEFAHLKIYYVATPGFLTATLNEDVLKRAIDRDVARRKSKPGVTTAKQKAARPWVGSSMALQVDRSMLKLLEHAYGNESQRMMQARAWGNLPILNEWKRRYPGKDPLKLHEAHWKIQLRCPGGGKYVWNEKYQTMESTVYGHPGAPKKGPSFTAALKDVKFLNLGVTFENKGLRARAVIERTTKR